MNHKKIVPERGINNLKIKSSYQGLMDAAWKIEQDTPVTNK